MDPRSLKWLSERIAQAPQAVMRLQISGHIATMGPEQELLAGRVAQFINSKY